MTEYTALEEIPKIRERAVATFESGKTRDIEFRKTQLLQLAYLIQDNLQRFHTALAADLGRPAQETDLLEAGGVIKECMTAYKKIHKWTKPEAVPFDIMTFAMNGKVLKDPKGTVLIIGPFNYPLFCLLVPFVGAITAGCTVILKPSELCPATEALLVELLPRYMDTSAYHIVTAEIPGTTKLLELQWDHIMYTGGGTVGKIIATAAAKHLTPVSLELGGKSPVIIDSSADIKVLARRLLWGKVINAGQTCISPDYVLVLEDTEDRLVDALKQTLATFFPEGARVSNSFSRIVANRHFDRLQSLLENTKGEIIVGGPKESVREEKYIAPSVVRLGYAKEQVGDKEDVLMQSELFGPILPILVVKDVNEAIEFINARPTPLALYIFHNNNKLRDEVYSRTRSGMAMSNDVILSGGVEGLPFGGTGPSGYGAHKDKAGFDTFTHRRSTIHVPGWLDLILGMRFPPYTAAKSARVQALTIPPIPYARPGTKKSFGWTKILSLFGLLSGLIAVFSKRGGLRLPSTGELKK